MGSRRIQPRMLNEVMDAIANLKESKGSTMRKIMNQMDSNFTFTRKPLKPTALPIMKALRHGVETGLIRRNKGKFKLGLDPKDYAVYKTFQKKIKPKEVCSKNKRARNSRRRRKGSASKHGRKRHHTVMFNEPTDSESLPSTAGK